MKKLKLSYYLLLIATFIFGFTAISCNNSSTTDPSTNSDVIDHCPFFLNTEEVGLTTVIDGTIFVRGNSEDPEDLRIQITAWFKIDEDDWGGISFNIPPGWKVDSIVSDYPRGNTEPELYTILLQTASEDVEFASVIEIGHTTHGAPDPPGESGTVIIEIIPDLPEQQLPETFHMVVGLGSKGDYVVEPVYEDFSVSLTGN